MSSNGPAPTDRRGAGAQIRYRAPPAHREQYAELRQHGEHALLSPVLDGPAVLEPGRCWRRRPRARRVPVAGKRFETLAGVGTGGVHSRR